MSEPSPSLGSSADSPVAAAVTVADTLPDEIQERRRRCGEEVEALLGPILDHLQGAIDEGRAVFIGVAVCLPNGYSQTVPLYPTPHAMPPLAEDQAAKNLAFFRGAQELGIAHAKISQRVADALQMSTVPAGH